MGQRRHSTQFPGVRYRIHPTRKKNGKYDRYFFIRYRVGGKLKEEGIGWASDGWNATRASGMLSELKEAQRTGSGPHTLAEKRELERQRREDEQAENKRNMIESLTFGDYFVNTYYQETKINKNWRSYTREKSLFELWVGPVIGKMALKDIRPLNLERIKKNMARAGRAPRSIQYALAVVRQVFNHAARNQIFNGENPARLVKKPKFDNRRVRFLTHTEADDLLNNLKSRSDSLYNMALVSLHCGLRAGEIFDLTWSCVDFNLNSILVLDTKSGRNRTVYMTKDVANMLASLNSGKPTERIFKDRKGKRIHEVSNAFGRAVNELKLNEGIEDRRQKVYFHSLRHTYASWLVQGGIDLYTVKELLGHSTLAMTERYSHLAKDTLKNAVKSFEKSISQNGSEFSSVEHFNETSA